MDFSQYFDTLFIGVIATALGYVARAAGKFIAAKLGSQIAADAAVAFLTRRQTAEAIWHTVEGRVETGIKLGVIKIAVPLEKVQLKVKLFVQMALDQIPGVTTEEATQLADEMTSRIKAGAQAYVQSVLNAALGDIVTPPPAAPSVASGDVPPPQGA